MQKLAIFTSFLVGVIATKPQITAEQLVDLSCYLITDGVKVYDLRTLQKLDGDYYEKDGLKWNYCAYLPDTQTFATIDGVELTSWKATVDKVDEVKDGVKVVRNSKSVCGDGVYSFTTVVTCNGRMQGQGQAQIDDVEGLDTCNPTVFLSHSAGCTAFDPKDYSWFAQNKLYFAVFALIIGPIIAFGGKRLFPYIVAAVISLFNFFTTVILCIIFGAFNTTLGVVLSLLGALALATALGCYIRRCFWLNVAIFGGIVGLALGFILYSLLAVSFKFHSDLVLILTCVSLAALGGVYAWYRGEAIIVYGTSFLGSYVIMRGIAAFYGGFPSISELQAWIGDDEELTKPGLFYLSIGIFFILFAGSATWQVYRMGAHETLANEGLFMRTDDKVKDEEKQA